jgi:proton-translocating NADH-quinone oxidoreductase chain M
MTPYLSLMILIPLIGAVISFFTKTKEQARMVALVSSLAALVLAGFMYLQFDSTTANLQFVENGAWIPSLGITYYMGVDGIGMPLVLLTAIVIPLLVIYSWGESDRPNQLYGLILATYAGVMGVFTSLDFFLFYIFWELSIIPMYFMIHYWGGPKREYTAIKFFLFTHVASLVMLLGIFALYFGAWAQNGYPSFDMGYLLVQFQSFESGIVRDAIFLALLFGFLVKIPSVPFHNWQPDAYVEAPISGSILLASLLSKMGGYGLFRVMLPLLPFTGSQDTIISIVAGLGVISILYGALMALTQRDLKRMIAFSSLSHMGFVLLGAFALVPLSVSGAMFQLFSHGLITCIMFMTIGIIQNTAGTRVIDELGGLAQKMPKLAVIMMFGFMAYLGLPGLSGFIAEFMVLTFSYITLPVYVILAMLAIVVTAGYHLWALQRAMFGTFNEKLGHLEDIKSYETFSMAVFALLVLYFGLNPSPVLDMMTTSAEQIVSLMALAGV